MDNNKSNGIKDEWVISHKSINCGGLILQHHIQPPDECETEKNSHHVMCFLLNDFAPRQVTRIDSKEYDGTQNKGDFWLNWTLDKIKDSPRT